MNDQETQTGAVVFDALHDGWGMLFSTAILDAAVEADHPSGKTPQDVADWAERTAEQAIEWYQEKIADEADVDPPEAALLHHAEVLSRRVLLETWREVRSDYRSKREDVRSLGEIAEAVARTLGFELPDDFNMESLDRDRFNVIYQ